MKVLLAWTVVVALTVLSVPVAVEARFMRDGFSSRMQQDFGADSTAMELDEMGGEMTQEMMHMVNQEWQLDPPMITKRTIADPQLRKHVQSLLKAAPTRIKVTNMENKKFQSSGFKAVAKTASGLRLRASWRRDTPPKGDKLNGGILDPHVSYDDVVQTRPAITFVSFELHLPPVPGDKKKSFKRDFPSIVYTVPIQPGSVNAEAIIARSSAVVTLYPRGSQHTIEALPMGRARASMPMRTGLVDPSWARGRFTFRKGRSVGQV